MTKRIRRPKWTQVYALVLILVTAFVLFDTFAIPRVQTAEAAADMSSIMAAEGTANTASSSDVSSTASASSASGASARKARSSTGASSATTNAATTTTNASANSTTASSAQSTANTDSGDLSVELEIIHVYDTTVYVADVQATSAAALKTALAQGSYGRNLKESTSQMAENAGATLAINGDYYGFRDYGYVIRNGVLYRDTPDNNTDALVIYGDGSMASVNQSEVSAQELLNQGAWQVLSFGPTLIEDGQIAVSTNEEVDRAKASNPRTAIGMIDPLHYVVVVSDGRTDESEGLSLYQLAEVLKSQGCTYAYNLDGGGSTTMWFNGEVVNNPTGGRGSGEREVSDIVYFS